MGIFDIFRKKGSSGSEEKGDGDGGKGTAPSDGFAGSMDDIFASLSGPPPAGEAGSEAGESGPGAPSGGSWRVECRYRNIETCKVLTIKAIRTYTGLGLKEARILAEKTEASFDGLSEKDARGLEAELKRLGHEARALMAGESADQAGEEVPSEDKGRVECRYVNIETCKILTIKAIRTYTGKGLKEAKALSEQETAVFEGLTEEAAVSMAGELKALGHEARAFGADGEISVIIPEKPVPPNLLAMDAFYVLYDRTFRSGYPYVGAPVRLLSFENEARALLARDRLEKDFLGETEVRRIASDTFISFFDFLIHWGIDLIRFEKEDGQTFDLRVRQMYEGTEICAVDIRNAGLRANLLSDGQVMAGYGRYGDRLSSEQDTDFRRAFLIKLVYRKMIIPSAVFYAILAGPRREGYIGVTREALQETQAHLSEKTSLLPEGCLGYEVHEGRLPLRLAYRKDTQMLPVFTDYQSASEVLKRFRKTGTKDSLILVTAKEAYQELKSTPQTSGMAVDIPTIGFILEREELDNIFSGTED